MPQRRKPKPGIAFQWGGLRPGSGRPPLPATVRRDARVTANLTRDERAGLQGLAQAADVSEGEALRQMLVRALQRADGRRKGRRKA